MPACDHEHRLDWVRVFERGERFKEGGGSVESIVCDVSPCSRRYGVRQWAFFAVLLGSAGDFGLLGEVVLSLSLSAGRACQGGAEPASRPIACRAFVRPGYAVATKQE